MGLFTGSLSLEKSLGKGAQKMKISGKTKILGVVGDPIDHTLSPEIHNFSASCLGLDICYVPLRYEGQDLKQDV